MASRRTILFLGAALAAACAGEVTGPRQVQGEWRLQAIQQPGGGTTTIADPARFTISFGADGRLSVRADCNSCGGSYRLADGSLSTGPLACTRAFCVSTAPLDTVFVTVLDGRSTVRLGGGRLTVRSERGTLVFER
jgi:heat shock protein HslJ